MHSYALSHKILSKEKKFIKQRNIKRTQTRIRVPFCTSVIDNFLFCSLFQDEFSLNKVHRECAIAIVQNVSEQQGFKRSDPTSYCQQKQLILTFEPPPLNGSRKKRVDDRVCTERTERNERKR